MSNGDAINQSHSGNTGNTGGTSGAAGVSTRVVTKPLPRSLVKRALSSAGVIDAGVVAVLLVVVLAGFWPVFAGVEFIRGSLVGVLVGAGIAWLSAWRGFGSLITAGMLIAAYFLFGTAAALPHLGIAQLFPDGAALRELAFGAVECWRDFVTASVPVGAFLTLPLVPFILALVSATVSFSAAWRALHPAITLIPIGVLLAAVISLGTTEAFFPAAQVFVILAASLPWLAWRRRTARGGDSATVTKSLLFARIRQSAILLGAAGVAVFLVAGVATAGLQRDVIRSHIDPPLDLSAYASPLTRFRAYVKDQENEQLFTVSNWDKDQRLRLAVMDAFDGMVFNVSAENGRYEKVGPQLGKESKVAENLKEVAVKVQDYRGIWLPITSNTQYVTFTSPDAVSLNDSLYYSAISNAAVVFSENGLRNTDSYQLRVAPTPKPEETQLIADEVASYSSNELVQAPEAITVEAGKLVGDKVNSYERIKAVQEGLQGRGFFSHGLENDAPSNPGHSSYRLDDLLGAKQWVGDDEQYATLMSLMLRSVGIPSRVVMGFAIDDKSKLEGSDWTVTGNDVRAWVEVPFAKSGWVEFDAAPDKNKKPTAEQPKSQNDPKPQVLQPPIPPEEPEEQMPEPLPEDREKEDEKVETFDWMLLLTWICGIGIPLLLLATPGAVLVALKSRRRNKRRKAPQAADRIAGGWQELLDTASDLGVIAPKTATRREAGAALGDRFGIGTLTPMSQWADRAVFAPGEPDEPEIAEYWGNVVATQRQLLATTSSFKRLRARMSLNSFRSKIAPTLKVEK